MDVTSVLKTLPEVMMLIPGCAGSVVSSTSLLTGLLHKAWVAVLGGSCFCAALQLFIHIFKIHGQNSESRLILRRNVVLKELKKKTNPIQTQQRIA